jgi:hypothetical protein
MDSKERPPMKKETTLKCKGLKRKISNEKRQPQNTRGAKKISDEKRGNPRMQGEQKKRLLMKKDATLEHK